MQGGGRVTKAKKEKMGDSLPRKTVPYWFGREGGREGRGGTGEEC